MTVGTSHNYYVGRAESDITKWGDYFCDGVAESFEKVRKRAQESADAGDRDDSSLLRTLDARQRKAMELFQKSEFITSRDVQSLFTISQRMGRKLLSDWAATGFVTVADKAKKSRKYALAVGFRRLLR